MARKRTTVVKELDRVFSIFIRQRDSDENGYITCVSCKKKVHWTEANNCHFADRRHYSTRWDEENCNAGCVSCNGFNQGFHIFHYTKFLDNKYGEGTAEKLLKISMFTFKISTKELEEKIDYYKLLIKN